MLAFLCSIYWVNMWLLRVLIYVKFLRKITASYIMPLTCFSCLFFRKTFLKYLRNKTIKIASNSVEINCFLESVILNLFAWFQTGQILKKQMPPVYTCLMRFWGCERSCLDSLQSVVGGVPGGLNLSMVQTALPGAPVAGACRASLHVDVGVAGRASSGRWWEWVVKSCGGSTAWAEVAERKEWAPESQKTEFGM